LKKLVIFLFFHKNPILVRCAPGQTSLYVVIFITGAGVGSGVGRDRGGGSGI